MLLLRWKSLLADTWQALVETLTLSQTQDLFCWDCNTMRATRVSRFLWLRNIQAKGRWLFCPVCGDRLLWACHMRQIRAAQNCALPPAGGAS